MDTPSETLWQVIETLLHTGNAPLARTAFRWSSEYAFLCGLKNAPVPVVITKFEQSFRPLRLHLDARLERSWEAVAALSRAQEWRAARRHFVDAVNAYYLYAIEVSKYGACEGGEGFWSVNKWH